MEQDDKARAVAAAELLIGARSGPPLSTFPESCRPRDEADAYRIQDEVAARLGPIEGWKVGASSPDAIPNCAPLLAGSVLSSPARISAEGMSLRGVEAEIAFRFGKDLPPRTKPYERAEVLAAIESACPAIEFCECRFRDWQQLDPLSKLADSNMNQALVIGPIWHSWKGLEVAAQPVVMSFDGRRVIDRRGGNTAGDLFQILVWLANHLSARGPGLRRAQIVITGSWGGMPQAGNAERVDVEFAGIGAASLRLLGERG
jgi:2-keto-4-pentenoate hydratase